MRFYSTLMMFFLLIDANAWWREYNEIIVEEVEPTIEAKAVRGVLLEGIRYAKTNLEKENAYLNDYRVKIQLPKEFRFIEDTIGIDEELLNGFIFSINSSATQATPYMANIFSLRLDDMNIYDMHKIIKNKNKTLTEYFKRATYNELSMVMKPIVRNMMNENNVSVYYMKIKKYYENKTMNRANKNAWVDSSYYLSLNNNFSFEDLERYVTQKAMDGFFIKMLQREKEVCGAPLKQKNRLIRDVFGKK